MAEDLKKILAVLERIAPLDLAADWDNVGLLVEPGRDARVERMLLTIDLTEPVLEEALGLGADMIIAYHPPIFGGLLRLTQAEAGARLLLGAIKAGITIYSPHTALDEAPGGLQDWLAAGLGAGECKRLSLPGGEAGQGSGRVVALEEAVPLDELIRRIKRHLGLRDLCVARPAAPPEAVSSIALCAGAGGSILRGATAQLYLTGEMRHHDVLAALAAGRIVILAGHTGSERGYLPRLASSLTEALGESVEVLVSSRDGDPLTLV